MASKNEVNLGYAEPYRNFIHIDDLINLYTRIINNPHAAKALGCFTIGPNNPIKTRDYAIAFMMDFKGKINGILDLIGLERFTTYHPQWIK